MTYKKLKFWYDRELAILLAHKITPLYPEFDAKRFIQEVDHSTRELELKDRVGIIADLLNDYLYLNYKESVEILVGILGPENKKETRMFTLGYWVMPIT